MENRSYVYILLDFCPYLAMRAATAFLARSERLFIATSKIIDFLDSCAKVWYNESMAINILQHKQPNQDGIDAIRVEIANGDLAALEDIIAKYGVRDARDIIAFSIGVLKEADGSPIAVQQKDGRIIKFIPKAIQKNAS